MRMARSRITLTVLWVAGFSLAMLGFLYLKWHIEIGPDAATKLFDSIISQYAPLLGSVVGFHFAAQARRTLPSLPYYVAVMMSLLWNLLVVGFVLRACLDPDKTQDAISSIGGFVPKLSWIVAPAIGFFFGKSPAAAD